MANELVAIDKNFESQWQIAQVFANSDLVPVHFKKPENAWIALNLAGRMGIDPFMLMQNLYVVHGKPGIEAKLAIALINDSGRFSPLEYEISGDGDEKTCVASASRINADGTTGQKIYGPPVSVKMAKDEGWFSKSGSKWKTMPDMMLRYRAATFFARVSCPEMLFGMQTKDEIVDASDAVPVDDAGPRIEYNPAQETASEPAYTLEKKTPPATTGPYGDNFPVICGNAECKRYSPDVPSHCGEARICVNSYIIAKCKALSRLSATQVLLDIRSAASGEALIGEAKVKLKIDKADTDELKWQIVEEILWGA